MANELPQGFELDQPEPPVQHAIIPSEGDGGGLPQGFQLDEDKYGTTGQQIATGLEGAASSATFGGSTYLEKMLGVPAKDIRMRREINPNAHMLGQIAGIPAGAMLAPEFSASGLMQGAGEAASSALGLGAEATGTAARIGNSAVKNAVETAMFQGGDEVSKMISNDPNQTAQTALTNIGLAGVLGGGVGAAIGSVSPIWKATFGDKAGQMIEDFKGRMNFHMENPDPVGTLTDELHTRYNNIKNMADEVYGAQGLKAQEIQKLMPEMNDKITSQVADIDTKLQSTLADLGDDANAKILEKEIGKWQDAVTHPDAAPGDIFNATQDLKQQLQEWGKFNKFAPPPIADRPFIKAASELSHDLRTGLEDTGVWGKAAERQQAINSAFKEYLPALQDFEKKFTAKLATGERVIDPTKINTYLNQLGKPNAELKQTMLKSFLGATDKYEKVIADTHANLGLENPIQKSSLNIARGTLNDVPTGAKLADYLVKKGFANVAGEGLGAAVGGAAGHAVGAAGIGALIGEHALGPFFSSVFSVIAKPLMSQMTHPEAFKAAVNYGVAAARGESLLSRSAKALFQSGKDVLPAQLVPTAEQKTKLARRVEFVQQNPQELMNKTQNLGHYLPGHETAVAQTASRAVTILNSLKPSVPKSSPLDTDLKPSQAEKAKYERALGIAQQPLMLLEHLKDGTLSHDDINLGQALYPDLMTRMRDKVFEQMTHSLSKGEGIPYQKRLNLSLFLGEPLDSTMTPAGIMSAQAAQSVSQVQANMQAEPKVSKTGMKKMNIASLDQTPGQARMSNQVTRR